MNHFNIGIVCDSGYHEALYSISLFSLFLGWNKNVEERMHYLDSAFNDFEDSNEKKYWKKRNGNWSICPTIGLKKVSIATNQKELPLIESLLSKWNVECEYIEPSDFKGTGLNPMANGSFSTYWKLDLISNLRLNERLMFFDADTLFVNELPMNYLQARIMGQELCVKNESPLLMVNIGRPAYEKVGLISRSPHSYCNAGFFFFEKRTKVDTEIFLQHYTQVLQPVFPALLHHDQDLINSFFRNAITLLPYRFNAHVGLIDFFDNNGNPTLRRVMNQELLHPIMIHSSTGIMRDPSRNYRFRKTHHNFLRNIADNHLESSAMNEILEQWKESSARFLPKNRRLLGLQSRLGLQ